MIKTFRGLLADGGQDRIRLSTIKGKVGYKITKFQIMSYLPTSGGDKEHVVQIWKSEQSSVPTAAPAPVDFTDSDLLGAAWSSSPDSPSYPTSRNIIFDNQTVNQDIFITHTDTDGTDTCNYYIELEVIPLDDAGAEYTTLKDLRQI